MLESGSEKTQPVPQKQRRNACMAVLLLTIVIAVGGCVGEMGFDGIISGDHMINNAYAEESVLLGTNEIAKLLASDGAAGDNFGLSVSVYNNTAVIGAYRDDDNGRESGSAYVFEKNSTGHWTQKEKLLASDGAAYDFFGDSVSVYNNTAIIGADADDDNGSNSGSAYVFVKNSTGHWTQKEKLLASDGAAYDFFGDSVSVYNNTAVIGADGDDDKGSNSGSAYVFVKNSTGHWTQKEKLLASDGHSFENFGDSVSVYNNTAVIGADGNSNNSIRSGSAYVFEKNSTGHWTQKEKLLAGDGAADENFGNSVSVYNNTAVIGAYYDDDNGRESGSAYVFVKNSTGHWTQKEKLLASDGAAFDYFGLSVSVYNNTAVIGADADDDNGSNSGSAYVFVKNSTGHWTQKEKLLASDGAAGDNFGLSVSVYNNTAVIGAFLDDDNGSNTGSAYVFTILQAPTANAGDDQTVNKGDYVTLDGTGSTDPNDDIITYLWSQTRGPTVTLSSSTLVSPTFDAPLINSTQAILTFSLTVNDGTVDSTPDTVDITVSNVNVEEPVLLVTNETVKLTASDGAIYDRFGYSVSVYNNTAVIGAYYDDDNGRESGSAYVFEKNSTGHWTQKEKLLASDGAAFDFFGRSVSVYNNTAVIGAYYDDDNGRESGSAYVFVKNSTGHWTQKEKLLASDGAAFDYFGLSVSVYNNTAIIGADADDDNGSNSGSAYVFVKNSTGHWTQKEKLLASDGAAFDYFGLSVSVYNNTAVISAYNDDDNSSTSGSAYVFEKNSTGHWTQKEKLLASDGAADDFFGRSVSVYNNTAVISAYNDGDNSSNSGSAYVFEKNSTGHWTQKEKLLASDGAAYDFFGRSVSVYNNTAVIGAYRDDDNGRESGSAYVFVKNSTGHWTQKEKLLASDGAAYEYFGLSVSVYNNTAVIGAYRDDDNGRESGSAYVFSVDTTSPTLQNVIISSNNTNSTLAADGDTVTLSFTASESIKDVTATIGNYDATVQNSTAVEWTAALTLNKTTHSSLNGISPSFTIDFADLAGTPGAQVTATTDGPAVTVDFTAPTPVIATTAADPTSLESIPFTVDFGESMTPDEFVAAEITLSSGTVTGFATSDDQEFAFNVIEADEGVLTVDVPASVATDLAGSSNAAADRLSIAVDRTAPTPVIATTAADPTSLESIPFTVDFGESMTPDEFVAAEITLSSGTVTGFATSDDQEFAFNVIEADEGVLTVDVPASVATDLAGSSNAAADRLSIAVDRTAPTPVIATTAADPTSLESIPFTVDFGESMTPDEFVAAEITLSSGTVTGFATSDDQEFAFNVIEADEGVLTVDVPASVATDLAGSSNAAADRLSIAVDRTAPTPVIATTAADPTSLESIPFTVDFGESMTPDEFVAAEITLSSGTVTGFATSDDQEFAFNVIEADEGVLTVDVPASVATDLAGSSNAAADRLSIAVDRTAPTPVIATTAADPTSLESIPFTVDFGESMTPDEFVAAEITLSSGTVTGFATSDDQEFAFNVIEADEGVLTVDVPASVATDLAGSSNAAADRLSIAVDRTAPTPVIATTAADPTSLESIPFTVDFGESMTPDEFVAAEITLSSGTVTGFATSDDQEFAFNVIEADEGVLTVDVPASVATDLAGSSNAAADRLSIAVDRTAPTPVIATTAADPTSLESIPFTVDFGESMTPDEFVAAEITLSSGTVTGFATSDDQEFAFNVIEADEGVLTVDVPASVATDLAGSSNAAADRLSIAVDRTAPTPVIATTAADPTSLESIPFTVDFGESMTPDEFVAAEITLSSGTVTGFATSDDQEFAFNVIEADEGVLTVDVPASVATDLAGSSNAAADRLSIAVDRTAPTPVIATTAADPTSLESIPFTVDFGESMTPDEFVAAEITLSSGTVTGFATSDDQEFAFNVIEADEGVLTVDVPASVATDLAGSSNAAADRLSIAVDRTAPTPVIATTAADPTSLESIPFTVDFGESMTPDEFVAAEITLSSGTVTGFATSDDQEFAFNVIEADEGVLTVDVPASVATDLAGSSNAAADRLSIAVDRTAPTPVIATTAADPTSLESIPFTVDFGESMTPDEFVAAEITLSSGTVTGFATSDDQEFAFNVIEADEGVLTVDVPASVATDLAGSSNAAADRLSIAVDRTAPTPVIATTAADPTSLESIPFTVDFGESMTPDEFVAAEITLSSGTVTGFATSDDQEFAFNVIEADEGVLTVDVPASVATDLAGSSNAAADRLSIAVDRTAPTPVIATTAADPTSLESIPFTVDFGESMTPDEFVAAEITLSSGTVTGFATSDDQEFAFNVIEADEGVLTVDVPASVATDLAGSSNAAADRLSIAVDRTAPTPVIATTAADPTSLESIPFTVDFGESMTPDEFVAAEITLSSGTVTGFATSDDQEFAFNVIEADEGVLTVDVPASVATDLAGSSNAAADRLSIAVDRTAPTPVIATTAADPTSLESIPFTVDFGESMTPDEFVAAEITLSSGTVTGFATSDDQEFAFNVIEADEGVLTVDVPASVATDLAGSSNAAADRLSIAVDRTAPTPVIATTAADPTSLESIPFTVDFGESMTPDEFVAAEITLSSGTVTGFATSDDQEFAFNVIEADEGVLTVDVPASVATDLAGSSNAAADRLSIAVDRTAPTPVIATTAADPTSLESIPFTVDFGESMTPDEFVAAEITLSSGTVTGFATSDDQEFAFNVIEADEGVLTVDVPASVATDLAGSSNAAADRLSIAVDRTAPTPVIATTAADPTSLESIPFTVDFGESMTPDEFVAAEITLSSGTVTGFATSDDQEFAFNVIEADEGVLTVDVPASVATDLAGSSNAAADRLSIAVDRTAPTPVIATTAADPTSLESIPFTVDFGESMTPDEFVAAEITLSSGTVTGFATSDDQEFAFNVIEADEGVLTVDVPASVATDLAGSSNAAADRLSIAVDRTAPTPVIATTAADPTSLESIPFTVDFGESMTPDEFVAAEITLSSGTVTGFATSDDQEFAFNVIEADEGVLTVDVPASVATDLAGSSNAAADRLSIAVDRTAPTPVIATTAADPTSLESIPFTVDFGESMTPDEFVAAEITLSSGTVTGFATSDDQEFAFNVIEADEGVLTVDVPASVATDLAGSSNAAADRLSIAVDRTAPTPVIATTAADPTSLESIPFTVDFGESMTPDEFVAAEITLSSGTVTGFATSDDQEFAFNVIEADEGVLTVDVPASVATDLAGSSNAAADRLSIAVDRTAPTPVIATTAADPTSLESIPFTVDFGESMTPDEFVAAEITLSSGTVTGFATSDDQEFAFNVIEADEGVLTVDVPASVATDLAGSSNAAADRLSIAVDRTAPTPVIATTAADPTSLESIPFTVDFGESMTPDEFVAAEITLSSGTVTGFATSDDQEFAFNVIEADEGVLTVDVPASVATDLAGSSNAAADQLSIAVDRTAPTPVIATTAADPTSLESIPFTVDFGESMTPDEFVAAEITLSSGTVTGFATSDDQEFAFNVIEADEGVLTVDVPASVATDLAGSSNAAADRLSIAVDRTAPTPVIATTAADPTSLESIPFTVDFGESMTPDEFVAAEITLSSGTVTGFATSDDQEFAFNVIEADEGVLTVDVPASVATDLAGSSNAAADRLSIAVDRTAPTPVIATTAADPTSLESIPFTVDFGESMTPDEFVAAEITLSSGTVTGFATSDDQEFAFNVIEADEGVLTVDVPASVATDLAGSSNAAADRLSIAVDRTAPTPVIATTAADPTSLESIPFTVDFGESMTPDEFVAAEITLSSGTVTGFATSDDQEFAFNVIEADEGVLTVDVPASVATDLAGSSNAAADRLSIAVDRTAPTPVIATTAADPTSLESIPFTVDFGESMTPDEFVAAEITLSSGTVTGFATSDDQEFAFNVIEADEGVLTVDVPASVATDLAGSSNAAADQLSIAVDRTAPTPVIATTAADPTSLESIPFTVDFGESMTPDEFVAAEITLSSGTVTGFATSDDQEFAFNVIEADEGVLTVDVPASVATDLAGSSNAAADRLSIAVDRTAPTPVIATTAADPTSLESIPFTVDFGESMTPDEFVAAEITLSSGTVTGFATSDDQEFAFNVIEADEGVLTVDVPASVATDLAGSSNAAADRLSIAVDRTAPTPVIATTAADPTSLESIPFTVDFGESMTPDEFVAAEITLSSGTVTGFATSDDQEFAFNVIEADEGVLTVDVPASVATDLAGSSNAAADQLSIAVDRTAPTPVIATTAADPTSLESIPFTVDFGESMTPDEFVAAEITLSSGTVTGFATSDDQEFAFNVIEADEGVLTVDVPASVATDLAGSSNAAADRLSIAVDRTAPTPVIATTAADPTSLESIPFTVDFGESMTPDEFVAAEITLSSGTVTGFATSDDQEFAFNVIEADEGVLTVDVPASVATDLAGSSNAAADRLSIAVDRTAPTPVIATTAADPTSLESIPFTVDFGESMTPDEFVAAEITLSSGTVTGFATSDDQEFAFNVIEADEGVLTVDVPASVATDLAGSSNAAADRLSIAVDRTAPTPVIATTAADPTSLESIPFTVDFGESMTPDEFVAAEITLSSGTVTGFATSDDQEFAFNVIEADEGVLTVDVPASVATDLAGSSNAAADRLSIAVDRTAPTPVIATTAADPTSLESIPFTVDFGESMTPDEFVAAEITLSSGTVTGFATSDDQEFAFNVIEADEGVLTVDVPASVATDLAGSSNAAADRLSIAVDRTAPTPVIATTAADPTSLESIPFTVDFGESMTPDEFVAAEITLSSGTVTGFATSDDQEFAFNVIEADEGVLTVDVPASVATDLAGSSNAAADQLSIAVDRTAPTPVIATTAADPTSLESIPFTVDFGESMTPDEFVAAEITLSSGTVTGFATSDDQEFAFNVIEADEGVLTVDVPASVATDLAGSSNAAADRLSIAVDRTAPTPVIATTAADPTSLESIPFTVDFGESMTPDEFVAAEITLSSGTVTGFATSDDQEFAFNVIEADEGVLTVDVPASVATDLAGSSNAAADRLSIAVDRTAPTPVIATTAADPTSLESIPFTVDFGESMTPDEFVAAEITLSSGTVTGFATSDDQEFAFNVIEADEGVLTVDVPASVATDLAGSSNAAADQLSIAVDRTAPTPVIATTAADPTSLESIPFTVDFGESMTPDEFVAAEITLSSGTVTGFATSDDQEFAFNVIEADEGVLTVDVPASVATDLAGSSNAAADRLSIAVDRTAPTPVIATTAADPTSLESIPFTVDFGESMTPDEFVAAEITLSSGTVTGFATSDDQEFAFNVIEADEGVLTVDVPASVATDLAGSSNAAADRLSIAVDRTAPTPVIATTAADPTSLESIPFTVDFGESMTPDEFVAAEITLSSGTVTGFATSDDQEFAFNVIEADEGVLTVDVPASVATDLAGSSNAAADRLSIAVDRTAPTPVIATTAADPTSLESIPFTVDFGESMTPDEFVAAEITLSSGNVIDFTPDSANQLFTFNVTSADDGEDLTVDVAANVAQDLAGNDNTAADRLSIAVDRTAPTLNPVTISSSNANSTLAANGDTVTLSFTASESIKDVTATIGNYDATVQNSTAVEWTAALTLNKTTHSSLNGISPSFTIDFADLAGTNGAQVTAITGGPAVTVDFTAPTLNPVTISSSNANSTLAANGDIVTLSFIASELIKDVTATIGNATATVSGSDTSWTAALTLNKTTHSSLNGISPSFTIDFADLTGNNGAQVTAITGGPAVTVDFTAPTLNSVTISSSNANSTLAANGDTVTLYFTASELIKDVTATIGNATATVSGSDTSWTAALTLNKTTHSSLNGISPSFTIDFADLTGNNGAQVTAITGGPAVTVDFIAPTLNSVTISSSNANSTLAANGDTVTLYFTASELIKDVTATIGNATATVSGSDTSWNATRTLDETEPQGALPFTINFDDLAGNPGVQVSATTDTIDITVSNVNTPPTANAGDDQTVGEGTKKVTLDGTGSTDPDGDTITYAWSQTQGPTVTLSNSTSASPTFDAPLINSDQTLTFFLTVNDGAVDSTPDTVDITVLDTDDALLTFPGSPPGSSGGGGGGGGGSGRGNTGVSVSGDDNKLLDDIKLYSVSWDCVNGLVRIVAGPDASDLHATVRTTAYGLTEATHASDEMLEGRKVFTSSIQPNESYLGVQLIDISGRTLQIRSESITITECIGEKTFDVYQPESTSAIIEEVAAKTREDTITGQRTIFDSPLHQLKIGIPADQVQCNEGLVLVLKPSMEEPACVTESTAPKLVLRGWHDVS